MGGQMMSLTIKDCKATTWKVEHKEKYSQANLSTSKKDKDGKWNNMYWRARFVGHAHHKSFQLTDKSKIQIVSGIIEQTKVDDKIYHNIVIFDFDNLDTPSDIVAEIDASDSELPF